MLDNLLMGAFVYLLGVLTGFAILFVLDIFIPG